MRKHSGISFFVHKNILAGAFLILAAMCRRRKTGVAWEHRKNRYAGEEKKIDMDAASERFPCNLDRRAA